MVVVVVRRVRVRMTEAHPLLRPRDEEEEEEEKDEEEEEVVVVEGGSGA